MAKIRPIKKHGTGLERWKDEKLEKNGKRGLLIQRKIGKSGKTRSKKEKKRKKTGKRKIFFKRERVSFHSRSNKFRQYTSLTAISMYIGFVWETSLSTFPMVM